MSGIPTVGVILIVNGVLMVARGVYLMFREDPPSRIILDWRE